MSGSPKKVVSIDDYAAERAEMLPPRADPGMFRGMFYGTLLLSLIALVGYAFWYEASR